MVKVFECRAFQTGQGKKVGISRKDSWYLNKTAKEKKALHLYKNIYSSKGTKHFAHLQALHISLQPYNTFFLNTGVAK